MQAGVTYSGIVLDGPGAGQTWTSASPTFDVAAAAPVANAPAERVPGLGRAAATCPAPAAKPASITLVHVTSPAGAGFWVRSKAAPDFRADPVGFLAGRLGKALKAARDAG